MSVSIPRPIILHGIHPPASSPTIIRLQRPITIPSALFTLPPAVTHSPSPLPTSSNMMHQFIPGLRPPLPQQDFPTKLPGDLEAEEDDDDEQSAQAADTYSDYMPLKRRWLPFRCTVRVSIVLLLRSSSGGSTSRSCRWNIFVGFGRITRYYLSIDHTRWKDSNQHSLGITIGDDCLCFTTSQYISAWRRSSWISHRYDRCAASVQSLLFVSRGWCWCWKRTNNCWSDLRKLLARTTQISLVSLTLPGETDHRTAICFLTRLSVSNDLKYDAQRDLSDIGAQFIEVHALNKVCIAHQPPLVSIIFDV